jgi:Ca2+/Na+ antiporter
MRIITAIITVITTTAGTPKTMVITTIAGTFRMVMTIALGSMCIFKTRCFYSYSPPFIHWPILDGLARAIIDRQVVSSQMGASDNEK